jgi:hypothetical protein
MGFSPAADLKEKFLQLSAPIPTDAIQWRQDGKAITRNGKYYARFVAYVDARFVQQRLDSVFPGDWQLALSLLPERGDDDGLAEVTFKAALTILGLTREDVGSGSNYKTASSDSFKRAAVRFGVAADLYAYEQNWVQIDGDGKYAKPVEDPAEAYARRLKRSERSDKGRDGLAVPVKRATVGEKTPSPPARAQQLPASSTAAARAAVEDGFPDVLRDPDNDGLPF